MKVSTSLGYNARLIGCLNIDIDGIWYSDVTNLKLIISRNEIDYKNCM